MVAIHPTLANARSLNNQFSDAIHGIGTAYTSMIQYCRGWFSNFQLGTFQKAEYLRSCFNKSRNLAMRLPVHGFDNNRLHEYLTQVTMAIRELRSGETLFVPGALLTPGSGSGAPGNAGGGNDAKSKAALKPKAGHPYLMVLH